MAQNEVVDHSISCVDLQSEFLSLFKLIVGTCLLTSTLSPWLEPIFIKKIRVVNLYHLLVIKCVS